MSPIDFIYRIAAAMFFGLIIGIERHVTGHPAGIRTNVLVSLGSCFFALFAMLIAAPSDTRIAGQIVTGIGFLCSGIIFKDGANVRGLITSATIWCTGAIGVLSSTGQIVYAGIATLALICANVISRLLADGINYSTRFDETEKRYAIYIVCSEADSMAVRAVVSDNFSELKCKVNDLKNSCIGDGQVEISVKLRYNGMRKDDIIEKMLSGICAEYSISSVGWEMM